MAKRRGIRLECPDCYEDVLVTDDIYAGLEVECSSCGQKARAMKAKKTGEWVLDPVIEVE